MRILHINATDRVGGAARVASDLHQASLGRGWDSVLAVGTKYGDELDVLAIPNDAYRSPFARGLQPVVSHLRSLPAPLRRGAGVVRLISEPGRMTRRYLGHEDFDHPASHHLLTDFGPFDLVHCHNLHGDYFDLRALNELSARVPVLLTLHDSWLSTGHCAHSFGCERWRTGCGSCPDLTIHPSIRRDATAYNWRRKRDILGQSRLHVAAPCVWLLDRMRESILADAMLDSRVIPNGVDTEVFRRGDRHQARQSLNLPLSARVLLFVGTTRNPFKDYPLLRSAFEKLSMERKDSNLVLLVLGEEREDEALPGGAVVRFLPYRQDQRAVALCFQSADVYVHATRVDTFPNAILEALACGTPVVATSVGGIPEQIRPLADGYGPGDATGLLVPPGDRDALTQAIARLLDDPRLAHSMGSNSARDVADRFDRRKQLEHYLSWYCDLAVDSSKHDPNIRPERQESVDRAK